MKPRQPAVRCLRTQACKVPTPADLTGLEDVAIGYNLCKPLPHHRAEVFLMPRPVGNTVPSARCEPASGVPHLRHRQIGVCFGNYRRKSEV